MINQQKIILQTKMAIYEKNYGTEDKRRMQMSKRQYILWKNIKTIISISIAIAIISIVRALQKTGGNLTWGNSRNAFITLYIKPYFFLWIIAILAYVLLASRIYAKRYHLSQERKKGYDSLHEQWCKVEMEDVSE